MTQQFHSRYIPKRIENRTQTNTCTQMLRAALVTIAKRWYDCLFYVSSWLGHGAQIYVVKHYAGCFSEGVYWKRLTFFLKLLYWSIIALQWCVSFLLYNKVNQLYIYIYPHISSLLRLPPPHPPYPTPLGGHKALS